MISYHGAYADLPADARKTAQSALDDGIAKFNEGDYKEALKDFDKAVSADLDKFVKMSPDSADGYLERGKLRIKLHDKSGATADLTQAAKLYRQAGDDRSAKQADALLRDVGSAPQS